MLDPWTFLLASLFVYRAAIFLVEDRFLGKYGPPATGLRGVLDRWAYKRDGSDRSALRGWVGDGLACTLCVSVYLAVATWAALYWAPSYALWVIVPGAIAGA